MWTFRFIHITSGCFLIGNSVSDVMWDSRAGSTYLIPYVVFGIGLLISGVINIILMKPTERMNRKDAKTWTGLMYAKAIIWVLFIPIPDLITEATGHKFPRKEFNCALVLAVLILSVVAKTLRDSKTIHNP